MGREKVESFSSVSVKLELDVSNAKARELIREASVFCHLESIMSHSRSVYRHAHLAARGVTLMDLFVLKLQGQSARIFSGRDFFTSSISPEVMWRLITLKTAFAIVSGVVYGFPPCALKISS